MGGGGGVKERVTGWHREREREREREKLVQKGGETFIIWGKDGKRETERDRETGRQTDILRQTEGGPLGSWVLAWCGREAASVTTLSLVVQALRKIDLSGLPPRLLARQVLNVQLKSTGDWEMTERNEMRRACCSDATSPDLWGTRRNLHAVSDTTSLH